MAEFGFVAQPLMAIQLLPSKHSLPLAHITQTTEFLQQPELAVICFWPSDPAVANVFLKF